ncbi:uncharacterized protein LOC122153722 [Tyto alba]|uniref:uncharacterized protein LOC122153722 n=1 Tax=Tyto alba TaxID=56313 RepID=UPI001C681D46|nr:uncharacterized protein LOC122153722 [Tyto alba]
MEGHTVPGHPPSLGGKGHAAASSPGNSWSPKAEAGGKPIRGPHRDSQGMPQRQAQGSSHALARVREPAAAGGHLPPPRGQLGPGRKGREDGHVPGSGEAHLCPGYTLQPCRGPARGLGSHFCVCRASRDRPSLNIVTAWVATCERGGRRGGCSHCRSPVPGEGRRGAAPAPQARLLGERGAEEGVLASTKLLTTSTMSEGVAGDKVCPSPPPGELNIKRPRFGKGRGHDAQPSVLLRDEQHPLPPKTACNKVAETAPVSWQRQRKGSVLSWPEAAEQKKKKKKKKSGGGGGKKKKKKKKRDR